MTYLQKYGYTNGFHHLNIVICMTEYNLSHISNTEIKLLLSHILPDTIKCCVLSYGLVLTFSFQKQNLIVLTFRTPDVQ